MSLFLRGAFLALSACSALFDLDSLRSDAGAFDAADAATDVAVDAAVDVVVDAGSDAGFCGSHPTALFCEDFDRGFDLTKVSTSSGGKCALTQNAVSPPNALAATMPMLSNNQAGEARFAGTAIGAVSIFHIQFDAKLVASGAPGLCELSIGSLYYQFLAIDPAFEIQEGEFFADGGSTFVSHPSVPFSYGQAWHHFEACLDLNAHTSSAFIDKKKIETSALFADWNPGTPGIHVGIFYHYGPSGPTENDIDNVLIDDSSCPP